jgi:hypothetical protein
MWGRSGRLSSLCWYAYDVVTEWKKMNWYLVTFIVITGGLLIYAYWKTGK